MHTRVMPKITYKRKSHIFEFRQISLNRITSSLNWTRIKNFQSNTNLLPLNKLVKFAQSSKESSHMMNTIRSLLMPFDSWRKEPHVMFLMCFSSRIESLYICDFGDKLHHLKVADLGPPKYKLNKLIYANRSNNKYKYYLYLLLLFISFYNNKYIYLLLLLLFPLISSRWLIYCRKGHNINKRYQFLVFNLWAPTYWKHQLPQLNL